MKRLPKKDLYPSWRANELRKRLRNMCDFLLTCGALAIVIYVATVLVP